MHTKTIEVKLFFTSSLLTWLVTPTLKQASFLFSNIEKNRPAKNYLSQQTLARNPCKPRILLFVPEPVYTKT